MRLTGKKTVVKALVVRVESLFLPLVLLPGRLPFLLIQVFLRMVHEERVMLVVLHYPLGTVRQQLSQDHVLQERERERVMFVVLHYPLGTVRQQLSQDHVLQERESYVRGTALSTRHCQTTAQPGSRPTRERELCSWYCTIHSALSDNSSARITSYKWERVMFVVLHYPLGTIRQQLSQDHVLQERERESYVRGTALSTRHCQTTAQPGSRPTRERERELCSWYCTIHSALSDNSSARITSYKRERERVMFVVLHYPLGTVRQQLSQDHVLQERERVMFVVLHYPLGTVRQQLSQDHVLQERESYVRGTALSTRHCQTIAQPGSRPTRERERELCSWYCTIHSALSDNSSARITSYKRERVMFVVLHYPLGTVRQ